MKQKDTDSPVYATPFNWDEMVINSKIPVLFIIGTDDVAIPKDDILQQTTLPDFSYIHILQEAGHMGMWEATDQLNKYLLDFIIT